MDEPFACPHCAEPIEGVILTSDADTLIDTLGEALMAEPGESPLYEAAVAAYLAGGSSPKED